MQLRAITAVVALGFVLVACGDTEPGIKQILENCSNGADDDGDDAIDCDDSECTFKPACSNSCGNGLVNAGEACDGDDVGGVTCEDLGFESGTLRCNTSCTAFDMSDCEGGLPTCGNGELDAGEVCDDENLDDATCESLGFAGGTVACRASCTAFDTSDCDMIDTCGDDTADIGEECDGSDFLGLDCTDFGFDGGDLGCDACDIDTSGCVDGAVCGDDTVSPSEDCDGSVGNTTCQSLGFSGGTLACDGCNFDTTGCVGCGDGVLNGFELCDGDVSSLSDTTCAGLFDDEGFTGNVGCTDACGLDFSGCQFEGEDFDYCAAAEWYDDGFCDPCEELGGTLDADCALCDDNDDVCSDYFSNLVGGYSCEVVTGARDMDCVPSCGDGSLSFDLVSFVNYSDPGEFCDGNDFTDEEWDITIDCGFFGLAGTLGCTDSCLPDLSGCRATTCGDGVREGFEDCDETDLGGATCADFDMTGAGLKCKAHCVFDVSDCQTAVCGNNTIEAGEECDGTATITDTCVDLGFAGGAIAGCDNSTCKAVRTACVGCGDGLVNGLETCDGTRFAEDFSTTCASHNLGTGTVGCTASCAPNFTSCSLAVDYCLENDWYDDGYCDDCQALGGVADEDCLLCESDDHCAEYLDYFGQWTCSALTGEPDPDCGTCGNGVIDDNELCDGAAQSSCDAFGFTEPPGSDGTSVTCDDCQPDFSACRLPVCGNDDAQGNEECDGTDLRGFTCEDIGAEGDLGCNTDCTWDLSECIVPVCGNNITDGEESCDGPDLDGWTCEDFGFDGGTLTCDDDCAGFSLAGCQNDPEFDATCGDGVVQGYETCDVNDWGVWGGPSCASFGLGSGTALCGDDCTFWTVDTSNCASSLGVCEANDWFDDGYCDLCFFYDGEEDDDCTELCGDDGICADYFDASLGMWTCLDPDPDCESLCGDGFIDELELCDHSNFDPDNLGGHTCEDFGFSGGSLSCAVDCTFSFEACEQ